jgi:predicted alpha/beta superfamily hydrolase
LNHTLTGTFRVHKGFSSRYISTPRDIIVYLPPGYNDKLARYPVFYMHDGQNLFDAATAFLGNEWGVDEIAESLIAEGSIEPLIIVGIYNTGTKRIAEYTPVRNQRGAGGQARQYGRLIVEELKPFIDSEYRTLPDRSNTALGGSSLGGLASIYIGLQHANTFGKLAVMSPSVWWANRAILRKVKRLREKPNTRIWLDIGTREGDNPQVSVKNVRDLRDALLSKGWRLDRDLRFVEDEGAGHDEKAWSSRVGGVFRFLFPPGGADLG